MSKVTDAIRAREKARRALVNTEPGLGRVVLNPKTKAEIQDELTIAGIEFPKKATKAELEALASDGLGTVTTDDMG